jgi:HSP20 family protein
MEAPGTGIKALKAAAQARCYALGPPGGGPDRIRITEVRTMYGSLFPRDVLAELSRLQSEVQQAFDISPSIRGLGRGGFPAVNVGGTPDSLELYVFAPGLAPASIEVNLDRGVLSIAGERKTELPAQDAKAAVHINERFQGKFRRVVSLPDDADSSRVSADYREGILHVCVKRREESQPRRITIQ